MPIAREAHIRILTKETLDGLVNESQSDYRGRLLERERSILLRYEDGPEGEEGPASTSIHIREGQVEIVRRGSVSNRLIYIPGEWTSCHYQTPMGILDLRVFTERFQFLNLSDRKMRLILSYQLELNGQEAGRRELLIEITMR